MNNNFLVKEMAKGMKFTVAYKAKSGKIGREP